MSEQEFWVLVILSSPWLLVALGAIARGYSIKVWRQPKDKRRGEDL